MLYIGSITKLENRGREMGRRDKQGFVCGTVGGRIRLWLYLMLDLDFSVAFRGVR